MRKLIISLAASAVITAGTVAGLQASSQASTDGNRLQATFTNSPVSVTPNLGMVELILSGTGTVAGFGAATEVVGLVQDHAVTPCGAGSYSDTVSRRLVMHGGVLVTHEMGMTRVTASGLQAKVTYQVDGQASTGIFAGARGTGDVTVERETTAVRGNRSFQLSERAMVSRAGSAARLAGDQLVAVVSSALHGSWRGTVR